jgi:uncharacterized membrane-anchored protein YhcB (DUF1043 family)
MNKNKIISTVLILTFFVGALQAQTYVQFNSELTPKENTAIKFYPDEIYAVLDTLPTDTVAKIKQYRIIVLDDTITVGKSVSDYPYSITEYQDKKNDFIKLDAENNEIYCDVKLLKKENAFDDTYIISENNTKINNLNDKIAKSKLGEYFRLVIKNQPTIWYKTSELTEYKTTPIYLTRWFIAIVFFIIGVAIGCFISRFFSKKEKLQEIEEKSQEIEEKLQEIEYDGSHLKNWAENKNTSIDLLKKHNPEYKEVWTKIKDKGTNWDDVQNDLKGKKLKVKTLENTSNSITNIRGVDNQIDTLLCKVKFSSDSLSEFANKYKMTVQELISLNPEIPSDYDSKSQQDKNKIIQKLQGKKLTVKKPEPQTHTNDFLTAADLEQAKRDIVTEIEKLLPKSDDKNKIAALEKTVSERELKISNLNNELVGKAEELKAANLSKSTLENKIKEIEKTVIAVDFLRDYAGKGYDYLNYCQGKVYKSAIELYNDLQQPDKVGMLLLNFETAVKDLQADKWLQILEEIKERGVIVTSNQEIIRSFSQPQSNEEKLRELKRFMFNELLVKYSSSLLILTEAFRNLNYFGVAISDTQKADFSDFVLKIKNKSGSIGMEIKYVPLFENVTEYVHISKNAGNNVSRAYLEVIKGLEKDDIAEIVSYGIVTEFDDTAQTQIKLAQ